MAANIQNIKFISLINAFANLGYRHSDKIDQKELLIFLNKKTSSGHFDSQLCDKLFKFLNIEGKTTLTIDKFIEGFLVFEDEIAKNAESFRKKFAKEKEIYNKILKQCELYKSENLNEEGFCKNAKIYGQVTDIDIQKKLEGIKEIIILVLFNNKKEELRFKIGSEDSNIKKSFEFKPTSRKDHFEFVMKGINDKGSEFTIGSKIFPLDEISSQEEYCVQIVIPEIEDPKKVAAYIKATVILYMSDYKFYEDLRKNQENRLKIFKNAVDKSYKYLQDVREIYGDLKLMNKDITVDFINEKLFQRRGTQLSLSLDNRTGLEKSRGNYRVEFNNEKEIKKFGIPLQVEFNNLKRNSYHFVPTKKIVEYNYKNNYNIDKISQNLENEKIIENNSQQISHKLPPKIERKVEKEINYVKIFSNISDSEKIDNVNNLNKLNINSEIIQKISKEEIITDLNKPPHQPESQPDLEKTLLKYNNEEEKVLKDKQQPYKEVNQNINSIINNTQNNQQFQNNIDIDALIKQKYNINNFQQYIPSQQDISKNVDNNNININVQQNTIQGYNIGNLANTAKVKNITKIQNLYEVQPEINNNIYNTNLNIKKIDQNIQFNNIQGDNSAELGRASIYKIVGNISKKDTVTSQPQSLKPIIKKPDYNVSVNKAIMHEKTNEILVSENTLPVSYLPEKINKLIVSDQVTYLPLATAQKKITYNNIGNPIITESNIINAEGYGNIISNSNNTNLNSGQNLRWKNITNSPQLINNNNYYNNNNYVYNTPNNMSNSNNYSNYSNYNSYNNYNINGNSTYNYYNLKGTNNNNSMWNSTVNSSKIITKNSYPQSISGNFQIQNKGQPIYLTQQIKY